MTIQRITAQDDVSNICAQLSADQWGADNDMAAYKPGDMLQFVSDANNILAVAIEDGQVVCSALCYAMQHPDPSRRSLYIDEIDTRPDHRRKGYASAMISWLRAYALEHHLNEVWLTTEAEDNAGTNAFYRALKPDEDLSCNLYGYNAQ